MAHKYRAKPTIIDGIRFDSKKEAARYEGLRMLQLAGAISGLELQPRFDLHTQRPDGTTVKVGTYVADFTYVNMANGEIVTEDVKGMLTSMYRLKRKWMLIEHGISILET